MDPADLRFPAHRGHPGAELAVQAFHAIRDEPAPACNKKQDFAGRCRIHERLMCPGMAVGDM